MLEYYGPMTQACLGTLFTWGLTALGSAVVVMFNGKQQRLLDSSLGFAAGVMLAASYWSLLDPALEMAAESSLYGQRGEYSVVPVAFGFMLGALFVFTTDIFISSTGVKPSQMIIILNNKHYKEEEHHLKNSCVSNQETEYWNPDDNLEGLSDVISHSYILSRRKHVNNSTPDRTWNPPRNTNCDKDMSFRESQWKRIFLLIVAVTIHNIPEGLAVGVGFGAIGKTPSATFENARNLAIGIGIQNFPEGLAVSLPLRSAGLSVWKSFWYGQLSGMVEPIFGVLGAAAVGVARPILPYALAFAAGAMVYVVVDDILPEASHSGNGKLASWSAIIGFVIMMILDVGLG